MRLATLLVPSLFFFLVSCTSGTQTPQEPTASEAGKDADDRASLEAGADAAQAAVDAIVRKKPEQPTSIEWPPGDWMQDREVHQICASLVAKANDESLWSRFLEMTPPSRVERTYWQDKGHPALNSLDSVYRFDNGNDIQVIGELRDKDWNSGSELIDLGSLEYEFRNDWYHLTTGSFNKQRPPMITDTQEKLVLLGKRLISIIGSYHDGDPVISEAWWIAPDGLKRPLCRFRLDGSTPTKFRINRDRALCKAAVEDRVLPIDDRYADYNSNAPELVSAASRESGMPQEKWGCPVNGVHSVKYISIDLNKDGRRDRIGYISHSYPYPSCGESREWALPIDKDGKLDTKGKLWREMKADMFGSRPNNIGHSLEKSVVPIVFLHRQAPYLLTRNLSRNDTIHSGVVYSFWGGRKQKHCEWRTPPRHVIERHALPSEWIDPPFAKRKTPRCAAHDDPKTCKP